VARQPGRHPLFLDAFQFLTRKLEIVHVGSPAPIITRFA
jgi:hypothetical protein